MKKNGFTFVELLAVIVIIGVLALISIPSLEAIVKSNKEDIYNSQLDNVILSLKDWASDNKDLLPTTNGDKKELTLLELKENGYIDYEFKNPKTNKCFSNSMKLIIEKVDNSYNYSIDKSTVNDSESCY